MTDIVQVVLLIFGGLAVSYIALSKIGDGFIFTGLVEVYNQMPEKFDMILSADNPFIQ
jgi:SSS family solute:Na+ symporter